MEWQHPHRRVWDGTAPGAETYSMGPGPADEPITPAPVGLPAPPYDAVIGQTTTSPGEIGSW